MLSQEFVGSLRRFTIHVVKDKFLKDSELPELLKQRFIQFRGDLGTRRLIFFVEFFHQLKKNITAWTEAWNKEVSLSESFSRRVLVMNLI